MCNILGELLKMRQNTAIYGYVPRTAAAPSKEHHGNSLNVRRAEFGAMDLNVW